MRQMEVGGWRLDGRRWKVSERVQDHDGHVSSKPLRSKPVQGGPLILSQPPHFQVRGILSRRRFLRQRLLRSRLLQLLASFTIYDTSSQLT